MKICILVLIGVFFMGSLAFCQGTEQGYWDKIGNKHKRALANLFASEFEIPRSIDKEMEVYGGFNGSIIGFFEGFHRSLARKAVSIVDLLTLPFPFDTYVFDPEFPSMD